MSRPACNSRVPSGISLNREIRPERVDPRQHDPQLQRRIDPRDRKNVDILKCGEIIEEFEQPILSPLVVHYREGGKICFEIFGTDEDPDPHEISIAWNSERHWRRVGASSGATAI